MPVAVCAVWFALAGSLHESVDAFLLINWRYTVPEPGDARTSTRVWLDLQEAYGVTLWLLVGGLVALGAALPGGRVAERRGPTDPAVRCWPRSRVGAAAGWPGT